MDKTPPADINPPLPARIRAITPLSMCDWPGKNVQVLFLGGCNLRCPTCHNASLAFTPALHPVLDQRGVLLSLAKRKAWLDGVVVCGGEPTLDPGLPALVDALSALGLPVKVDTNGMLPEVLSLILALRPGTHFAVDVKGPWNAYPALTGGAVTAGAARDNLEAVFAMAASRPGSFTFRITKVPGLTPDDIREAAGQLPSGFALREQAYVPPQAPPKESSHALADREARRMSGNVVPGADLPGHP